MNIFGWQGIVGAVVLAAITSAWITSTVYSEQILSIEKQHSEEKAVSATEALNKLTSYVDGINISAIDYGKTSRSLGTKIDLLAKDFQNVKTNPLPIDCKPDANRMRALSAAIATTNSAIGP